MEANIIFLNILLLFLLHYGHAFHYPPPGPGDFYMNTYLLDISEDDIDYVEGIGRQYNLSKERKILDGLYLFRKEDQADRDADVKDPLQDLQQFIVAVGNKVTHIERQVPIQFDIPIADASSTMFIEDITQINDYFPDISGKYYDPDIEDAWSRGYYGNNVTVAIVDVGIDMFHKDLDANVDYTLSYNYVDRNYDATSPKVTSYPETIDVSHGTECAGLVAAEKGNMFCSAGVAPKAKLVSIRFLGEDLNQFTSSDDIMTSALSHERNKIDIYSNSWGYAQHKLIESPHGFKKALETGVKKGRDGKGNIFVFPAGNYHPHMTSPNCNTNGLANNIQGITISSVGMNGRKPNFTPVCTSVLAVTLGEGSKINTNRMFTTSNDNGCTHSFKMTSASVALASGIIALMLEANESLSWRDVQHIIVETSSHAMIQCGDCVVNGAGKKVSRYFGFGLMNASAIVEAALKWTAVPEHHTCEPIPFRRSEPFEKRSIIEWKLEVDRFMCTKNEVNFLEHVEVQLQLNMPNDSYLSVFLSSPSSPHYKSPILTLQSRKDSYVNRTWTTMTVHFWGEVPLGQWRLIVETDDKATIESAKLIMYGTATDPRRKADENKSNRSYGGKQPASNSSTWKTILVPLLILLLTLVCCYWKRVL